MSTLPKLSATMNHVPASNPDALRVDEALQLIKAFVQPHTQSLTTELIPLQQSLGRVLAKDLISPINVPAADNSAMDGYAFNSASLLNTSSQFIALKNMGAALAGKPFLTEVEVGTCIRIMTGASMPLGCDTVIPQELVQIDGDLISFATNAAKAGDNRRLKGEDLKEGKPALLAGKIIRPADLGLIASLGISQVTVNKKLRVGFFQQELSCAQSEKNSILAAFTIAIAIRFLACYLD